MTKEEIKQWIRNQIDSSIKTPNKNIKEEYNLCYNKSYIRALKLSKITGNIVNKDNFTGGDIIFHFDTEDKEFWYYSKISIYLEENYTNEIYVQYKMLEEVFNEYEDYKGYNDYNIW